MSNEKDKQHLQELAAYRFTVENLRERVEELEAQFAAAPQAVQAESKIGYLLALARIMIRTALDADNKTEVQEIKAAIESEVAFERALRAALAATQPAAQGMEADLTDEQIDEAFNQMPNGATGFLKSWGYRQFARAVIAAQAKQGGE